MVDIKHASLMGNEIYECCGIRVFRRTVHNPLINEDTVIVRVLSNANPFFDIRYVSEKAGLIAVPRPIPIIPEMFVEYRSRTREVLEMIEVLNRDHGFKSEN